MKIKREMTEISQVKIGQSSNGNRCNHFMSFRENHATSKCFFAKTIDSRETVLSTGNRCNMTPISVVLPRKTPAIAEISAYL